MRRNSVVVPPTEPPAAAASTTASSRPTTRRAPPSRAPAAASGAPSAAASASAAASDGKDGSDLPAREGYVIVHYPKDEGEVFFTITARGPVNEKLRVPCGTTFVRVGVTKPNGVAWLSEGRPVAIACQKVTEVTMQP
jgi:hypothetical protein